MRITKVTVAFATLIALQGVLQPVATAQEAVAETYFEYPKVPESLESLNDKSNFFIENFWKRCNLKSAFSSKQNMEGAFRDYVSFMPFADAEVVHNSIDKLISEVQKNPKNLLTLGEIAEATLYSDTAKLICDECYLPFAKAVAGNKKISKAEKARFEYQASALGGSQVGMTAPDFEFTRPDGTTGRLSELPKGAYVLLFINDPDCTECELARMRLSADVNLNDLIDSGNLIVLSIYPGEPDDDWKSRTTIYNKKWIVGAMPEIDEMYDMRNPPVIYYLNGMHKILSKNFDIDNLLEAFRQVNAKMNKTESIQE